MATVKVGCLHVNPSSTRGRRVFLLQMVALCFIPHVALIIQNCSIMAQLSQTFDASLYLNDEVRLILALGEAVVLIQDERLLIYKYLYLEAEDSLLFNKDSLHQSFLVSDLELNNWDSLITEEMKMKLYHVRKETMTTPTNSEMDISEIIAVYQQINSVLLIYMMKNVKETKSALWRQLSASYDLVKSMEELSISYVYYCLQFEDTDAHTLATLSQHIGMGLDHLMAMEQFFEWQGLTDQKTILEEIVVFYKSSNFSHANFTQTNINSWNNFTKTFLTGSEKYIEELKVVHKTMWNIVRDSVIWEVWVARRTLILGMVLLVVVLSASPVLIWLLQHTVNTIQCFTNSIERSTQELMAEKQKSDLLLSRMLPLPVLRRLRAQKTVPAESFEAVTIYFSDIVGFTNISANSTPMEIINMLNMLYRLFDDNIMKYNVYKVETIGDAYMVVSGLPQRNGNRHVSEIADMALSLMRCLDGAHVPHRPGEPLRIRAGINTGPCVAGVVGTTMPRYCLFGDTINTASRMESTGEAMKIHISQTTKEALDEIGHYVTEPRGVLDVAGKGTMETYWLLRKMGDINPESPRSLRLQDYDQNILELLIK